MESGKNNCWSKLIRFGKKIFFHGGFTITSQVLACFIIAGFASHHEFRPKMSVDWRPDAAA